METLKKFSHYLGNPCFFLIREGLSFYKYPWSSKVLSYFLNSQVFYNNGAFQVDSPNLFS